MLKIYWLFSLFSTLPENLCNFFYFCNEKTQKYCLAYVYYWVKLQQPIKVAIIVVKCSVTSVWSYELLCADRSIRLSDCSIRVSRFGKSFLCRLCPEIASKIGIFDSFTPSLFLKLFQHNSRIPSYYTALRPLHSYYYSDHFISTIFIVSVTVSGTYIIVIHTWVYVICQPKAASAARAQRFINVIDSTSCPYNSYFLLCHIIQ